MTKVDTLKRRWQKEDDFAIESAISALATHAQGRKFLWWLLEIGRVGLQPYSGNALGTAFACGELNVGQRVLDRIIAVTPDGYISMMKENADERRKRDDELDRADGNSEFDYGDPADRDAPDGDTSS